MTNCNDKFEPPEKDRYTFTVSFSGIYNWFKKTKTKRDIDNIKDYENKILEEREKNGEES